MVRSKKLKSVSGVMVVLAFGLAGYFLWQSGEDVDGNNLQQASALSVDEKPGPEPEGLEANPDESATTLLSARLRPEVDPSTPPKRSATEVTLPHNVVLDDYKNDLWADILDNPPEFRQPGDPELDADMAYRLYMYFGNCSVLLSRGRQIDKQMDRIASRAETARGRRLEDLEGRLDEIIDYYELCLPIPVDVDARMEAVIWMSEAVRLGHEISEVQFYEKAMGFLMRPDPSANNPPLAMKNPGLVAEFKTTARYGLARALEKGHPEAYLAKSRAVLEGLIYPKDPLLAYAYARKAELEAAKNQIILSKLAEWKQQSASYLSQEQISEAEQLALELDSP